MGEGAEHLIRVGLGDIVEEFQQLVQEVAALKIQLATVMNLLAGKANTYVREDHTHKRDVKVTTGGLVGGIATTFPGYHKHSDENRPDFKLKEGAWGTSGQVLASNGTSWEWTNPPAVVSSTALELLSCSRSDGIPCERCRLTPPKGYQTPDQKRFICSRCYDKGHRLEEKK